MGLVLPLADAAELRQRLPQVPQRLVFTNGCFDLLHAGHVRYLQAARLLGDALVVGLNGDASVRELKGPHRPVNGQDDRAEVLAALAAVDAVIIFPEKRATRLIEQLHPEVYAKGGDYTEDSLDAEERAVLQKCGAEIHLLPLVPGRSTTATLRKMQPPDSDSPNDSPLRLGILGSGKGSNFQAIVQEIEAGRLRAEIAAVLSDVPDSGVLQFARAKGFATMLIESQRKHSLEPETEQKAAAFLLQHGVEVVVLAGFMRILKHDLLRTFDRRIINLHPSLLPKFPGMKAWEQALIAGEKVTGCTVHFVDAGVDTGEIILQEKVAIEPGDTPEILHARIQEAEHRLFPQAIARLAGHRAFFTEKEANSADWLAKLRAPPYAAP